MFNPTTIITSLAETHISDNDLVLGEDATLFGTSKFPLRKGERVHGNQSMDGSASNPSSLVSAQFPLNYAQSLASDQVVERPAGLALLEEHFISQVFEDMGPLRTSAAGRACESFVKGLGLMLAYQPYIAVPFFQMRMVLHSWPIRAP